MGCYTCSLNPLHDKTISMTKAKVPYVRKPAELSLEDWQIQLRKQFAVDQHFKIKNIGNHPFFSDFEVYNPESGKTYKVLSGQYRRNKPSNFLSDFLHKA